MDDYPQVTRTWATLRLSGSNLDPEEITSRLGITPSDSLHAGDQHGKHGEFAYKRGHWSITSQKALTSRDLEEHIDWVLDQLRPAAEELKALLARGDIEGDMVCFWETEASEEGQAARLLFSPRILGRIASLNLVLDIETCIAL